MTTYAAESFYRAKINASILKNTACPITVPLSKLPTVTNGLLTMSPNTEYEEIFEYNNPNPTTMTVDLIKRWVKPSSVLLTTNWVDYNNATYQFDHTQNDIIRGDVNHIHLNQGIGNTVLATNTWVGISKLSVAAASPSDPIVVWDNDPRLVRQVWSYFWNMTSGANLDTTFRNIAAFGTDNDNEVAFSWTLISGLWTMIGTITNNSYSTSIVLWNGDRCRIWLNASWTTNQIRVVRTWGFTRLLAWTWSFDLTNSNQNVTFMNASSSPMTITFQAWDASTSRLIAGLIVEVF